jgi:DNA anti-recombination protein RmuC
METIPAVYWMVIIGVVTLMLCLVLYYIAMLIKESRDAVKDSREIIKNADSIMKQTALIMDDVQDTVTTLKGTIISINDTVLVPIKKIGSTITIVGDFLEGLKRK